MPKTIAIVDDERDIRAILSQAIEATRNWTVLEAQDGVQGLDLIRRERPDAVLLDVMMPRMDGREMFSRLKRDSEIASTPVIFITASMQKHDIKALEALGPVAVLAKPFDPIKIVDTISELLNWNSD